ncbi:MAG: YicC family protein [Victivallaceae bacterium]|nr:YicC family protein [Victivallaceae bacterium]
MIRSMTGFGKAEKDCGAPHCHITVETVSVNRKQLDLRLNLPRELAAMEPELRSKVAKKVGRGSVSVKINCDFHGGETAAAVNLPLLRSLVRTALAVRDEFGMVGAVDVAGLMRLPGVIDEQDVDRCSEELSAAVGAALDDALDAMTAMRDREGEALKADLCSRLDLLKKLLDNIRPLTAAIPVRLKEKLMEKLASGGLPVDMNDDRMLKEVLFYADKNDTTEEVTRLDSHFAQFMKFVDSAEPAGRNLDFLLQEMFREITTLSNKAGTPEISPLTVAFKSELEKLREQIQNAE